MDIARYAFSLEFYNELAAVNDPFLLAYFTRRNGADEVELTDVRRKRKFLARTHYPGLKLEDIVLGGKITIFSRQYRVVDFADDFTRKELGRTKQKCFGMVSPAAVGAGKLGVVWAALESSGLRVTAARMLDLSPEDCATVASGCAAPVAPGRVVALEVHGEDAPSVVSRLADHLCESRALPSGGFVPAIPEHDARLRAAFFGPAAERLPSATSFTAQLADCACAVILPSAVTKNMAGAILQDLEAALGRSLSITALTMLEFSRKCAEEYLEVYKFVVPEIADMVNELCGGMCVVLEVSGPDAVPTLRTLAGPRDVDIAKRIRPDTLRAKYGASSAAPGIHVTDLPQDGPVESEYVFSLMTSS